MLKNKQVIWHVKRKTMRNVYVDTVELEDLLTNLKPVELRLYNYLMGLAVKNPSTDAFETKAMADVLNVAQGTIKNARASLKHKGYLVIRKFTDESGDSMVRVVLGKDQVQLYNLGLKVEITDSSQYKALAEMFMFNDPTMSPEERKERAEAANTHYLSHMHKSK